MESKQRRRTPSSRSAQPHIDPIPARIPNLCMGRGLGSRGLQLARRASCIATATHHFTPPTASAAPLMARAGRSLMEPDGLALSSLRNRATVKVRDFNERRFAYEVENRGHQTRYSISLPRHYTRHYCLYGIRQLAPKWRYQHRMIGSLPLHPIVCEPPQFADEYQPNEIHA
jgi:hypothetical protein